MKTYLLLFTIGPVQTYIAQARKTQDMYAGSKLLGNLIKIAIDKLKVDANWEIIFPNIQNDNYPNRFLAFNKNISNESTLKKLGFDIQKQVLDKYLELAKKLLNNDFEIKGVKEQLENQFEFYWLFEEVKEADYRASYYSIEQKMGAIKNNRPKKYFAEVGKKCSLDGINNVKFYNNSENRKVVEIKLFNSDVNIYKNLGSSCLAPGEGLSAPTYIKRLYKPNDKIVSTAEIALMHILEQNKDNPDFNAFNKLIKNEKQLFYNDNITEKYLSKQGIKLDINTLKDTYEKLNIDEPTPYYAILNMDADNIGQWLNGQYENCDILKPDVYFLEYHKELASVISQLSTSIKNYIIGPKGMTIYAGGDDFIAFINLYYIWDIIEHIQNAITILNKSIYNFLNDTWKESLKLTYCISITIAHYKTPLQKVIQEARIELSRAKLVPNKNALGIMILKHSGEYEHIEVSFSVLNETTPSLITDIQNIQDLLLNFSNRFISKLDRSFTILGAKEGTEIDDSLAKQEIFLALSSTFDNESKKDQKQQIIMDTEKILNELYIKLNYNYSSFLECLSILFFINRQTKI